MSRSWSADSAAPPAPDGTAPVGRVAGRAMALNYSWEGRAMANVKLRVSGMTCGHCQAKVENALKGVTGVYSAIIDLPDGEAEVDFDDDSVTTEQLVAAVAKAGYGAKVAG